jgi:type III pantothenate kinase
VLLTIDVGNTNTVIGCFDGDQLTESWRIKTDNRATADELALLLRGLLTGRDAPAGIAACSTVPSVLQELRGVVTRYYTDVPTVIVEPGVKTGVPLLYDNPREVGADRIVNSLAAFHLYGGPAIVVDFGTSTNFDVVNAAGEFAGGVLAPGIEISMDALFARAARLPKVPFTAPERVISQTTTAALQSGLVYGFAGQVDAIVDRIRDELGAPEAQVIATGGLADVIAPHSTAISKVDPWLTLEGLRLVWERNR